MRNGSGSFDWGMHYLRAFAIVAIMVLHLWCCIGLEDEAHAFLSGSTIYFLFISGYLCQYLGLKRSVEASAFLRRKFSNVVSPYLVCSAATILIVLMLGEERCGIISPAELDWGLLPFVFLFGWAQVPYWYIPFVCFLFLASPLVLKLSTSYLVLMLVISFAASLCFPFRAEAHLGVGIHSLISPYLYFAWSYLLGFVYARQKQKVDAELHRYVLPSLAFGILLGIASLAPELFVVVCKTDVDYSLAERTVVLTGPLARSLQKLFFLVPMVVMANKLSNRRIPVLDCLAKYSFTMYFTHQLFVNDFVVVLDWLLAHCMFGRLAQCGLRLLVTVLFISFNLLLAMFLKKMFGRYSRCIIGS